MHNRVIALAAAALLSATGLATAALAQDKTEVTFWSIWDPATNANGKFLAQAAADFSAANPDVNVTIIGQGGYDGVGEKLDAALIANATPTIAQIDESFLARYAPVSADLGQYLEPETIANYQEGLTRSSYIDGKFLAAPFNRSTPILYVNSTLLKAAGLPPEGPKTWDELKDFARKVADPANGIYGLGAYWDSDAWYWESALYSWGGDFFTADNQQLAFNTEAGIRPVADFQDLTREGVMFNTYAAAEGEGAYVAAFLDGKVGMMINSIAGMSRYYDTPKNFDLTVAFQPAGTKNAVVTGGANLIILSQATEEQKKAAGRFIDFLASDDIASRFADLSGYFPTTRTAAQSDIVKARIAKYPGYQIAIDQLATARIRPQNVSFRAVYTVLVDELVSALTNLDRKPADVIDSAYKRGEQILAEAE